MKTQVLPIDPLDPSVEAVNQAAELIRKGELVAFPTETVYGLGANALDANAVKKIYEAKGRPQTNPIIVHVSGKEQAQSLVTTWTEDAEKLAEAFWPGPLTIVLPKNDRVPSITTAGSPTVALRCPDDETALMLIETSGFPIAAPSANTSGNLSPVDGFHVLQDLEGKIPMLLDSGQVPGGIESTVIDLSGPKPKLLRPGLLQLSEIEQVIGPVERGPSYVDSSSPAHSPGLLKRHYAPHTPLIEGNADDVDEMLKRGKPVGMLNYKVKKIDHPNLTAIALPGNPKEYAYHLYRALRELDEMGVDTIFFEMPPERDEWLGIRDRLTRASAND